MYFLGSYHIKVMCFNRTFCKLFWISIKPMVPNPEMYNKTFVLTFLSLKSTEESNLITISTIVIQTLRMACQEYRSLMNSPCNSITHKCGMQIPGSDTLYGWQGTPSVIKYTSFENLTKNRKVLFTR